VHKKLKDSGIITSNKR